MDGLSAYQSCENRALAMVQAGRRPLRREGDPTGNVISLIDGTWQPGGFAPLPHVHRDEDETFYTLAGQFEFRIGGDRVVADAGTLAFVPRGTVHGFTVVGVDPARLLAGTRQVSASSSST